MIGFEVDFGLRQLTRSLSLDQWVLRATMAGATVICMVATMQASSSGGGAFWLVLVSFCGFWAVVSPDTAGPWTLIATLVLWWWASVDDPMSGWVLVLALGVLTIHAAAALVCTGPPSVSFGRETLARWGSAVAAIAGVTLLLGLVLHIIDDADAQASTMRLALALVVVALLAWWLRRLTLHENRD